MDNPTPNQPTSTPAPAPRERIMSFEQMKVWQEAHALVLKVFQASAQIPSEHQDAVASTIEKAAIEIPKSIAEGFRRRGSRNKAHYYNLAQSALEALRYLLILARDLKCPISFEDLWQQSETVTRMLEGLVRSITRSDRPGGGGRGGRRRGGSGGGRDRRGGGDEAPSESGGGDANDDWDDED